ncbi:PH domain-containing protein [Mycetocola tolaasinivorans]|uniref:PH domain-containing protein n=1 Tax=Mycetocola tolaasinivorans TaxID=76635 RepID=A0A3L7A6L4_9MICO|nr:PH domain-containing protein [Mycetocola tolaasinivorans]RLP75973.1 PH domain-containing protein [Mycetocola tolaasinivorans]
MVDYTRGPETGDATQILGSAAGSSAYPTPSSVPTERVVARLRRHGSFLILPSLLFIALPAAVTYGVSRFPTGPEFWMVTGGAAAVFLFLVLWPYLVWLNRRTTITTRRVVMHRGFLVRERREVFHSRGYEIATRRGPLQLASGSATILLTPGTDRPLVLVAIPGARQVVETLHHLIEVNQVVPSLPSRDSGTL